MALFTMKFKTAEGLKKKASAGLAIKAVQLMSDQLKEIECTVRVGDVVVSP